MRWLMVVAAMGFSGQAVAADQFDLICTGEIKLDASKRPGEPTTVRYRVDLKNGRWCEGSCERIKSFHEVTPDQITFEMQEPVLGNRTSIIHRVRRTDGDWADFYWNKDSSVFINIKGACEPADFTEVAPASTKF